MTVIQGQDPRIVEIIQSLGISLEGLKEVHIHITPDDVVSADAIYVIQSSVEVDPEKLQTILKRYRLEETDPKPLKLGGKVRITTQFVKKGEEGKLYYLTVLGEGNSIIKWDNLTSPSAKPFQIENYKIEPI
jgi:hypothetical protein